MRSIVAALLTCLPLAAAGAPPHCESHFRERAAFFGALHIHTALSFDAYSLGTRLGPDEAYAFASGEAVELAGGSARLGRPLDFAAVTDHAEFLGETLLCTRPGAAATTPRSAGPIAASW